MAVRIHTGCMVGAVIRIQEKERAVRKIFVDFEMHPIREAFPAQQRITKNEIIEFGAVMLDEADREIGSYQSYVRPEYMTSYEPFIRRLTGIREEDLAAGRTFAEVLGEFLIWCRTGVAGEADRAVADTCDIADSEEADTCGMADGAIADTCGMADSAISDTCGMADDYLIYSWSDTDLRVLRKNVLLKGVEMSAELAYMFAHWVDFQASFDETMGLQRKLTLDMAIEVSGVDRTGRAHNGLDDARNTSLLYVFTQDPAEGRRVIERIRVLLTPHTDEGVCTLGDLIDFSQLAGCLAG